MYNDDDQTQLIFRAVADPTRRLILSYLSDGDMTVGHVAEQFDMSRPAVAKHLGILEEGGLISVEQQGRERVNRLQADGLKVIKDWAGGFDDLQEDSLISLKRAVEEAYESVNSD